MPNHSLGNQSNIEDPYSLLALYILDEAFRNIRSYFSQTGTPEEKNEGKKALVWMKKMQGNFKVVAMASKMSLEGFHQLCLWKINNIKKEIENEKTTMAQKDKQE